MVFLKPTSKDGEPHAATVPPLPPTSQQGDRSSHTAASPFEPARDRAQGTSVIGTDLTILGEQITIISQNRLQIDGDVRADVTGKQVTIGREGSVIGTVRAEAVEVHGGVRGAIRAHTVALHATSQVDGEILHQNLSIAAGAQFDGSVKRSRTTSELVPNLDPAAYAPRRNDGRTS